MRKFAAIFLIAIFINIFSVTSGFATETEFTEKIDDRENLTVTMAINEETIFVNGACFEVTAPILVLNRTYVDLYALAPIFDAKIEWVEDYIGFFRVTAKDDTIDFTRISKWDDLINFRHKFFVKDSKIYVSLRELADMVDADIAYSGGIINVGNNKNIHKEAYANISLHTFDDYIYRTYPCPPQYVVTPYYAYSYEFMKADTERLKNMYPDLIKSSSIGKSVEGRELLLIEFGRGDKKIFVCGTHHAREYISTTYLMYAIDRYAYAYRTESMWGGYNPREILDNVTFCIVPMVNPDGVNLVQNGIYATNHASELESMGIYDGGKYSYSSWKANVNGVDVNWNYDRDWDYERNKNPRGSSGFNGDYPGSEPETAAVTYYVNNNSFEAYLSFHTQGQIFYWADNEENPSGIYQAIGNDTGFIGYKESATGVGGSFFDYVYRNFQKPTVTVELCPYVGNFPYPDENFDTIWRPAKNILLVVGSLFK